MVRLSCTFILTFLFSFSQDINKKGALFNFSLYLSVARHKKRSKSVEVVLSSNINTAQAPILFALRPSSVSAVMRHVGSHKTSGNLSSIHWHFIEPQSGRWISRDEANSIAQNQRGHYSCKYAKLCADRGSQASGIISSWARGDSFACRSVAF